MNSRLSLVGMPIGNAMDITLRALDVLKSVDFLLVEDTKVASRYFRQWQIPFGGRNIALLNEHTTDAEIEDYAREILQGGHTAILSDSGMPVICDPGDRLLALLLDEAKKGRLQVDVIPGANAALVALVRAGLGQEGFYFAGFLPRKPEERRAVLRELAKQKKPIVVYEAPYRLKALLEDVHQVFPPERRLFLGIWLTSEAEKIYFSTVKQIAREWDAMPKGPPVLILY